MKLLILCTPLLIFTSTGLAQKYIEVKVTQPPPLEILNLDTLEISEGNSIKLGAEDVVKGGYGDYLYNWSPADNLDHSFVLQPIATPQNTLTYTLKVQDKNGCTAYKSQTVNVIPTNTGFLKYGFDQGMIIFFNPVTRELFIDHLTIELIENTQLKIFNTTGSILMEMQLYSNRINLEILDPGIYILSLIFYDSIEYHTKIILTP